MRLYSRGYIPLKIGEECRGKITDYEEILKGVNFTRDWLIVGIVFSSIMLAASWFDLICCVLIAASLESYDR